MSSNIRKTPSPKKRKPLFDDSPPINRYAIQRSRNLMNSSKKSRDEMRFIFHSTDQFELFQPKTSIILPIELSPSKPVLAMKNKNHNDIKRKISSESITKDPNPNATLTSSDENLVKFSLIEDNNEQSTQTEISYINDNQIEAEEEEQQINIEEEENPDQDYSFLGSEKEEIENNELNQSENNDLNNFYQSNEKEEIENNELNQSENNDLNNFYQSNEKEEIENNELNQIENNEKSNTPKKSFIKENVAKQGGNVNGVLRFSIQWNDIGQWDQNDLDAHCIEPNGIEIMYRNRRSITTKGVLDIDIKEPIENCPACENIVWPDIKKMMNGTYTFFVQNYEYRNGHSGFRAEIQFYDQVFYYDYRSTLEDKENVYVAEVKLMNGQFSIKHLLNCQ